MNTCISQATAWRVPYDQAVDKLTASLAAAKASEERWTPKGEAAVLKAQADLAETWAALGSAKAAAKAAEALVDQVEAPSLHMSPPHLSLA